MIIFISDESDTATGNKERKLKDLRLKEVHLKIPEQQVPTDSGSETEVTYSSACEPVQVTSNYSVTLPSSEKKKLPNSKEKRCKKECIVM